MIKGLCLDTILLNENYIPIKIQNIKSGDMIKGIDKDLEVISVIENFEETYTIVPEDRGEQYHVSRNMILPLKNIITNEIEYKTIDNLICNQNIEEGVYISNYRLLRKSFDHEENHLLIDPYFTGLLIGDKKSLKQGEERFSEIKKIYQYPKDVNFQENLFFSKENIFNSRENRLKLLAGIIDSNGIFEQGSNSFEVEFLDESMADNIIFLTRSLGIGSGKRSIYKYNGKKMIKIFRVYIYGKITQIPTKFLRIESDSYKDYSQVHFTIYHHRLGEVYSLEIKDDDKRFLTNGFDILSF